MKVLIFKILPMVFFIVECSTFAQNLVVNGNFSEYLRCPQTYTHYKNNIRDMLPGWNTVNKSTPDFFNRCSQHSKVGVPENFAGITEPFDGDGYIGLILRADPESYRFSPAYSEHITGTLNEPLKQGKKYCFSMKYIFARNSGIMTNGIGVYFSAEKPEFGDSDDRYSFEPQLILHPDSMLRADSQWTKLSAAYTAQGGEKYLTIGNFLPLSESVIIKITPEKKSDTRYFAYYYIDAISLVPDQEESCSEITELVLNKRYISSNNEQRNDKETQFTAGKIYTLQHVLFDFDKSVLRTESYPELNKIAEYLTTNPEIHIHITGHTDNTGSDSFNMKLSEVRAKAVFEYFYRTGIAIKRMTFSGMGSKMPVSDNDTENGRQLNRRVEIKFINPNP